MLSEDYRPWKGDSLTDLAIVRGPNTVRIRIIEDSPGVRLVLSRYASLQSPSALGHRHASVLRPDLSVDPALLHEFQGYAYFEVPGGTHCKIRARADVRCRRDMYTSTFVKVRITSGTYRGTFRPGPSDP
jgi:hypothetical protein